MEALSNMDVIEKPFNPLEAFDQLDKKDAEKPSDAEAVKDVTKAEDTAATEDTEDGDETSTDDSEEESTDEESETDDEEAPEEDDGDAAVVKVKVDGEEREFTLGSLKRLAGQEATLTRKSQEVAQARNVLNETAAVHVAALDKLLERARKAYEPYSKIDFLVASKDPNISGEELAAVREQANERYETVRFLEEELGSFAQQMKQRERQELQTQAAEAIKVLTDPEKGIKGWNDQLYMDLRSYAVKEGIPQDVFDRTVDPGAIKILHKAMLYDRGKTRVQTEKSATKKAPKKIVKSTTNPEVTRKVVKEAAGKQAFKKLESHYTFDNAVAAFEERFTRKKRDD